MPTTVTFQFSQSVSLGGTRFFDWSSTANWSDVTVPTGGEAIVIGGPGGGGVSLDDLSSLTIPTLAFAAGAGGLRIDSGDVLTVTSRVLNGSIGLDANSQLLERNTGLSYVNLLGNGALFEVGGIPQGYLQFSTNAAIAGSLYIQNPESATPISPGVDPQVTSYFSGGDQMFIEESASGPLTAQYIPGASVTGELLISDDGTPLYEFSQFRGNPTLDYQASETTVIDPLTGRTVAAVEVFVCFARGTRIAAPGGMRRVESLREGEFVLALEGGEPHPRRVRWIGHRRLDLTRHSRPELAAPIRFRAGALGDGLPTRDLLVSPDHAMLLDGRLVPAKLLLNGMTILQERHLPVVAYYHVELEEHAILLAEGVPTESYLDTGNRGFFDDAGLPLALHPDLMARRPDGAGGQVSCAPVVRSIVEVEPIWRALAERARDLGFSPRAAEITVDPDLRLQVDGAVIRPQAAANGRYHFVVPSGATAVRLVSRHFLPGDTRPYADDWRRLGVAVSRLVLQTSAGRHEIAADHPAFTRGWHASERSEDGLWRWTDGNAVLPLDCASGGVLQVHVHATGTYPDEAASADRLAA